MTEYPGEITGFGKSGGPLTGSARELAQTLGKARREGRNWRCICPVHGGHSLVLGDGENALLVKCFGGNCARRGHAIRCWAKNTVAN